MGQDVQKARGRTGLGGSVCSKTMWEGHAERPRGGPRGGGHEGGPYGEATRGHVGAMRGHMGATRGGHKGAHGEATRGRPQGAKRGGHDGEAMGATQGEVCLGTTEGSGRAEASSQPGRTPCYSWSPARGTRGEQGSMRGVPDFDQVP